MEKSPQGTFSVQNALTGLLHLMKKNEEVGPVCAGDTFGIVHFYFEEMKTS